MSKKISSALGVIIACVTMFAVFTSPVASAVERNGAAVPYVGFKLSSELVKSDKAQRHYPYLFVMSGEAGKKIDATEFPLSIKK